MIGSEHVHAYVDKFEHITLSSYFKQNLINYKPKHWSKYVNNSNEELVCDASFDLMSKMLLIDHTERISAKEAIMHPYFDSVRHLE